MSRIRRYLVPLVFYILLAFIILHPIISHTGTHVTGFDYFNYHWNFWWIRHALTTPGLDVYETNFTFFPFDNNLGYHALTAFWFPVWALLEPLSGTFVAMTAIIALAAILNGYIFYWFLRRSGIARALALLGGMALQCVPLVRYFYYNTHINLMDWFWLPAQLLLWQQVAESAEARRWRRLALWAVVQGIALYGLSLTDHQFPIFTAFVLVPYGLLTLWRTSQRVALVGAGLLAVAVTVALLWFAGPLPHMLSFSGTLAPGPVEERPGVPFPRGYLWVDPVWWEWNVPTLGGFATIATLLSLIAGLSPLRRAMSRDRWFWFAVMIPPLLLSMGPDIVLFGQTIPMPYRLLHAFTGGMLGMPWRFAPIYVIAAMTFVGMTWTPLLPRTSARRVWLFAALFLLLAMDTRLFQTGPLQSLLPQYTFYETIGAEQGEAYDDLVIVEVPTGVGTGEILVGDERAIQLQLHTMTHHKRTINGFISRAPVRSFWYINTEDPMLSWLGQRRFLEPEAVEAQLRERIFEWPIGYIIIHQDLVGRGGPTLQEIFGYFNNLPDLLCPVFVEGDAVVYRTTAHPDGCPTRTPPEIEDGVYEIDIGSPGDEQFIGWGWHRQEEVSGLTLRWSGEYPQALVYTDLPPDDYTLTFNAQAFWEPRELTVMVNDVALGDPVRVPVEGLAAYSLELPADIVGDGKHLIITFVYDDVIVPEDVGQSADQRRLAVSVDRIRFQRRDSQ